MSNNESSLFCLAMEQANGAGDEGDVFGFRKARFDNRVYARMPVDKDAMFYNMNHKNRGRAVIFNHENFQIDRLRPRSGTEVDAANLKDALKAFGFDVSVYHDLNYRELKRIVDKGKLNYFTRIYTFF